jgi:hypothetical protein
MKAQERNRDETAPAKVIGDIASLAAAVRILCMANHLRLDKQSLTVTWHPRRPVEIDFTKRQPLGFAFTAGNEATFHVPHGHRFVIENMNVSCWAKNDRVDVQLVTKSSYMFRQMSLTCWPEQTSPGKDGATRSATPILVNGSTANTFLFSNGDVHSSSTVPRDTYVQVWGYLEPAYEPESF